MSRSPLLALAAAGAMFAAACSTSTSPTEGGPVFEPLPRVPGCVCEPCKVPEDLEEYFGNCSTCTCADGASPWPLDATPAGLP